MRKRRKRKERKRRRRKKRWKEEKQEIEGKIVSTLRKTETIDRVTNLDKSRHDPAATTRLHPGKQIWNINKDFSTAAEKT